MPVDPAESLPDAGFDVVRRGYDLGQVDTHLRRIDAEIAILAADRNAAVDQSTQLARELDDARARAEKLRAQVRTLAGPPQSVQGMSERMRSMLRLAEDEVSDMLGRAETDAAQRRQEAEQHAAQLLAGAQEESARTLDVAREKAAAYLGPAQAEATELAERTMRERAQLTTDRAAMEQELAAQADATRAQLDGVRVASEQRLADERAVVERELATERAAVEQALAAQRATVEREIAESTQVSEAERTRMWTESEQRRTLVEEDFTIAMDQRRSEAIAALWAERTVTAQQVSTLRAEHDERVRQEMAWVESERRRIIADAERRVTELTELRGRIADQLSGARSVLGRTIGSLEPLPGEPGPRTNGQPNGTHPDGTHPDGTHPDDAHPNDAHPNDGAPNDGAPNGVGSNTAGQLGGPADDSPTIRTEPVTRPEPATLTDLDPSQDVPRRPSPQHRTRASASHN